MQGLHRQVDAWRDHTSLEAAITTDHVQRDGGPAVDNDQWSGIELERAERIDKTVRSDLRGLPGPNLEGSGIIAPRRRRSAHLHRPWRAISTRSSLDLTSRQDAGCARFG